MKTPPSGKPASALKSASVLIDERIAAMNKAVANADILKHQLGQISPEWALRP